MFYRKYRPQKFSQIFGNKKIIDYLIKSLNEGNLSHAFLFHGPRGTGKTTTARLLAKSLACENFSKNNDACLKCESCKMMQSGRYADLIEIDAASNNSVDNIRDINERIGLSPTHGKFKFYIVDEVHMLSKGAFNALLKTLEEPPKNIYFVLATTEPEKVPDTIKSRCQNFEFERANTKDVVEKLKYILNEESENVEDDGDRPLRDADLKKIAESSRGGFRDAETLLEQVLVGGLSVEDVLDTTGLDFTARFFDAVLKNDASSAIKLINDYYEKGKSLENWNKEILFYLRQIILLKQGLSDLLELDENILKIAEIQAREFSKKLILKSLKAFNNSLENIKYAYIPTLPLEIAVLEVTEESEEELDLSSADNLKTPPQKDTSGSESSSNKSRDSNKPKNDADLSNSFKNKKKNESMSVGSSKSKSIQGVEDESAEDEIVKKKVIKKEEFKWEDFLQKVQEEKPSLTAALNTCKYLGFDGNTLIIEAYFSFHKERLDLNSTRMVLEELLLDMIGEKHLINCVLSQEANKNLTDKNVKYVTVSEDQVPQKTSSDPEDDFEVPANDPNFVGSPVSTSTNSSEKESSKTKPTDLSGSGSAVSDFSGDFEL